MPRTIATDHQEYALTVRLRWRALVASRSLLPTRRRGQLAEGIGGERGRPSLWEIATDKKLRELPGHAFAMTAFAFSADSKRLAAGGPCEHHPCVGCGYGEGTGTDRRPPRSSHGCRLLCRRQNRRYRGPVRVLTPALGCRLRQGRLDRGRSSCLVLYGAGKTVAEADNRLGCFERH